MTTYTPDTQEFIVLPEASHYGDTLSLNAIATEYYGSKYIAQQTGEMLPNDSTHHYNMSPEEVDQWCADMEDKRHYLGYVPVAKGTGDFGGNGKTVYHVGHNQFEYWLSLRHDPDNPDNSDNPHPGEDHYGESFKHDFQVYRQAPEPWYVLADLIRNGVLPHGDYLMEVSW